MRFEILKTDRTYIMPPRGGTTGCRRAPGAPIITIITIIIIITTITIDTIIIIIIIIMIINMIIVIIIVISSSIFISISIILAPSAPAAGCRRPRPWLRSGA